MSARAHAHTLAVHPFQPKWPRPITQNSATTGPDPPAWATCVCTTGCCGCPTGHGFGCLLAHTRTSPASTVSFQPGQQLPFFLALLQSSISCWLASCSGMAASTQLRAKCTNNATNAGTCVPASHPSTIVWSCPRRMMAPAASGGREEDRTAAASQQMQQSLVVKKPSLLHSLHSTPHTPMCGIREERYVLFTG